MAKTRNTEENVADRAAEEPAKTSDERKFPYEVLKEKRIGGAGLDVYAQEPLSCSSPLIGLDNIILTPHVSSQTYESLWYTYKKAIDIMADFYNGNELDESDLLNPDYLKYR